MRPILRKPSLDPTVHLFQSFWKEVCCLNFLTKSKKVYLRHICQCAYRPCHSTKTASLCALNDLLNASDHDQISALTLLDWSAAGYTIDHDVILYGLEHYLYNAQHWSCVVQMIS